MTLWTLSTSHYLPTRAHNAPASDANTLKFSMVRTMYRQGPYTNSTVLAHDDTRRLSQYYRDGNVVESDTYFDNNIDSTNQARHLPTETDSNGATQTLRMSSFRGCAKNHLLTPTTPVGTNRRLSTICSMSTVPTKKLLYSFIVGDGTNTTAIRSNFASRVGLEIDRLSSDHKLFIWVRNNSYIAARRSESEPGGGAGNASPGSGGIGQNNDGTGKNGGDGNNGSNGANGTNGISAITIASGVNLHGLKIVNEGAIAAAGGSGAGGGGGGSGGGGGAGGVGGRGSSGAHIGGTHDWSDPGEWGIQAYRNAFGRNSTQQYSGTGNLLTDARNNVSKPANGRYSAIGWVRYGLALGLPTEAEQDPWQNALNNDWFGCALVCDGRTHGSASNPVRQNIQGMSTTSGGDDGVREVVAEVWGDLDFYGGFSTHYYYNGIYPARKTDAAAEYHTDDGGTYGGSDHYMIRIPNQTYNNADYAPLTPQRTMAKIVWSQALPLYVSLYNFGAPGGFAFEMCTMWLYPVFRTRADYGTSYPTANTWKKYCRFATQTEINTFSRTGTHPSKGGDGGSGGNGGSGGKGGKGGYYDGVKRDPDDGDGGVGGSGPGSGTNGNSGTTIRSGTQPSGWETNNNTAAITTDAVNLGYKKTWGSMTSGYGGTGVNGGSGGDGGTGGRGGQISLQANTSNLYNAAPPGAAAGGTGGSDANGGSRGNTGSTDSRFVSYTHSQDNYGETFQPAAHGADGGSGGSGGDGGNAGATGAAANAIGFLATEQAYTYTESTN
jgi:hypothetical protein